MAASVRDADQKLAVRRGGEEELRVRAQFPFAIVVVGVVKMENRKAVGGQPRSRRAGFDNVALLLQRMGRRGCVEIGAALSVGGVEKHIGIGSLRHAKYFDHIALEVNILVQFHLLPVFQAHALVVRVDTSEIDEGVARGLKLKSFDRPAVSVQHFNPRIHRRAQLRRLRFDDPPLAGLRFPAEQINV